MLCYAMICCAMLCYDMLCYDMLCYAVYLFVCVGEGGGSVLFCFVLLFICWISCYVVALYSLLAVLSMIMCYVFLLLFC
jgi:hypothetical protein